MRNIIHLLYLAARHWAGMAICIFAWSISLIYLIDLTRGIPYGEPANTFAWLCLTIFLAFKLGEVGRKIHHEKKLLENRLEEIESNNLSSEKKIEICWKILRSRDLDKQAIDKIIMNTYENSPIQNAALEKRKILQEATIF